MANTCPLRNVIIAGGGTGGHIYPGVAIARALESLHPNLKVHFVGARGGLEEKIIPRENFPLHTVPVGRLHHTVGLLTRIRTLLTLPLALWRAAQILNEFKPVAVLGVGGFASGPLLLVASIFGYRTLIWEPNAYPGLTNRMLARRVSECLLVFDEAAQFLHARKITRAGLPVRASMKPNERVAFVRADSRRPLRILVFGGSQGARFINNLVCDSVMRSVRSKDDWLNGIEIVHQTGSTDFARLVEAYKGAPDQVKVFEYLHDMDARYRWADLVVCRSGASTVAEIAACEKAAIFIPLPTAADDHQRKNAAVLAQAGAAVLMPQNEATTLIFRESIARFRDDRTRIQALEENVKKFQFPQAAERIVERMLAQD